MYNIYFLLFQCILAVLLVVFFLSFFLLLLICLDLTVIWILVYIYICVLCIYFIGDRENVAKTKSNIIIACVRDFDKMLSEEPENDKYWKTSIILSQSSSSSSPSFLNKCASHRICWKPIALKSYNRFYVVFDIMHFGYVYMCTLTVLSCPISLTSSTVLWSLSLFVCLCLPFIFTLSLSPSIPLSATCAFSINLICSFPSRVIQLVGQLTSKYIWPNIYL